MVSLPILVIGVLSDLEQGSGPPLPISKMRIMWEKLFCVSDSQNALNSVCAGYSHLNALKGVLTSFYWDASSANEYKLFTLFYKLFF